MKALKLIINGEEHELPKGVTSVNGMVGNVVLTTSNIPVIDDDYDYISRADRTEWNNKQDALTAGEGIEIKNKDYSAMRGPCPEGFHVPLRSEWGLVHSAMVSLQLTTSNDWKEKLFMPFAGLRRGTSVFTGEQGDAGSYWTSTPGSNANYSIGIRLDSDIYVNVSSYRSRAHSIRPFKDVPVTPDNTWTKLYGTDTAGIFHNATLGLISVVRGDNIITIADKNLGATQVYNNGDTLSEANCGKYYQRGNNYGFERSSVDPIQSSSTRVDASNYGPGNYYSSSIFITTSESPYDWSSIQNDNLRGGVTGVVEYNNSITNTGVLSVNGENGDVVVNDVKKSATAPANPTEGTVWYDTTNDILKTYDGTNWNEVGAGTGDIKYEDFEFVAMTGTVIENLSATKSISADTTLTAGSSLKEGMQYLVRVTNTDTASHNITFGGDSIEVGANETKSFVFLATSSSTLELQTCEGGGQTIIIDTTLSTTSTNPVQNKVITEKLDELELGVVVHSSTAPASASEGMLWYDTTNKILKIYNGTSWENVGNNGDYIEVLSGSPVVKKYEWIGTEAQFLALGSYRADTEYKIY